MFSFLEDYTASEKRTVYVSGFGDEVGERDISKAFLSFGDILSVIIRTERRGGSSHRYGFIEFERGEDAESAIDNMHLSEMNRRTLNVNYARPLRVKEARDPMRPVWADEEWLKRYGRAPGGEEAATGDDSGKIKKHGKKQLRADGDEVEGDEGDEDQQELVQIPAPKFI